MIHDFSQVKILQAYNSIHSFDINCLLETFLDSSIQLNHPDLLINDYALLRDDHSDNVNRGGVCITTKIVCH